MGIGRDRLSVGGVVVVVATAVVVSDGVEDVWGVSWGGDGS